MLALLIKQTNIFKGFLIMVPVLFVGILDDLLVMKLQRIASMAHPFDAVRGNKMLAAFDLGCAAI